MVSQSLYQEYSIGIMAQDVVNGNPIAAVIPIEKIPILPKGETVKHTNFEEISYVHKGVDSTGRSYTTEVAMDNAIKATFLNDDNNLVSVPLLRTGQRVMLYKLRGSNEFFWKPLGTDSRLQERDHQVKMYAATGDEDKEGFDGNPNKAYTQTTSPATGVLGWTTSKANGEPAAYVIQVNTKEGAVIIQDDLGNLIHLDSVEGRITLKNKDDCHIDLNKTNARFHVPNDLELIVGGNVVEKITGNRQTNIGGNMELTVDGSTDYTCPTVNQHSNQLTVECPDNDFIGIVKVGALATTGTGGNGNASISGGLKAEQDVVAGSISLQQHRHKEQGDGRDTSTPL